MPSHLRLQSSFEGPVEAQATYHSSITQRPAKRTKRMSISQTYSIAATARTKLGKEAGRADHDLRLLVGHANMLDELMVQLSEAEKESQQWLDDSIREAARSDEPRRIRWVDQEDQEALEDSDDESDDGSELDDEEMFTSLPQIKSAPVFFSSAEVHEDAEYDAESEEEELALMRVPSRSPPELTLDDSDSSDEEDYDMPEAPQDTVLHLSSEERKKAIATTAYYFQSEHGIDDFLQAQQPLIAAC